MWQRRNAGDRAAPDIQEEGARAVLPGSKSAWGFPLEAGGRAKAGPDLSNPEVSKPAEREVKGDKTPLIHDEGFVPPEDVEPKADRERPVLPASEGSPWWLQALEGSCRESIETQGGDSTGESGADTAPVPPETAGLPDAALPVTGARG